MITNTFIHFREYENFSKMKLSADPENKTYIIPSQSSDPSPGEPDISWNSISFIKDRGLIYTHGRSYGGGKKTGSTEIKGIDIKGKTEISEVGVYGYDAWPYNESSGDILDISETNYENISWGYSGYGSGEKDSLHNWIDPYSGSLHINDLGDGTQVGEIICTISLSDNTNITSTLEINLYRSKFSSIKIFGETEIGIENEYGTLRYTARGYDDDGKEYSLEGWNLIWEYSGWEDEIVDIRDGYLTIQTSFSDIIRERGQIKCTLGEPKKSSSPVIIPLELIDSTLEKADQSESEEILLPMSEEDIEKIVEDSKSGIYPEISQYFQLRYSPESLKYVIQEEELQMIMLDYKIPDLGCIISLVFYGVPYQEEIVYMSMILGAAPMLDSEGVFVSINGNRLTDNGPITLNDEQLEISLDESLDRYSLDFTLDLTFYDGGGEQRTYAECSRSTHSIVTEDRYTGSLSSLRITYVAGLSYFKEFSYKFPRPEWKYF